MYTKWAAVDSVNWKHDQDEVKSAKIILEEARESGNHGLYKVEPIPLRDEPGFVAIAFALPDLLRKWGGRVRELSLDSACEFDVRLNVNHVVQLTIVREHKWVTV